MGITDISRIVNHSLHYKVRYFSVSDPLYIQFEHVFRTFFKDLGPVVETRAYAKLAHYLKKVRYQLSINILPYDQIVSQELLSSLEDMLKQGKLLNLEYEELFEKILKVLQLLHTHESNALFECLKQNIFRYTSYTYCIVSKREMNSPEKDYILSKLYGFNITFMGEKTFKEEKNTFDYVIFMGNESYFHPSFNNIPKSRITAFISRDIYQNKIVKNPLFDDWPFPVFSTLYKNMEYEDEHFIYTPHRAEQFFEKQGQQKNDILEELIASEEQIEEPIFSSAFIGFISETITSFQFNDGSNNDLEKDMVPAKAFELHGDKFIFIRISRGQHDVITEDHDFKRKRVNEIVTGDSLILSSINDEGLVERMADKIYEHQNIKLYRQRQAKLKSFLLSKTEKLTIEGFCKILKRKGLITINEAKIKNLLKPTSFKLQNKKEFFEFLMILTKNDEKKAMKYFEAGRRLAVFHISAGKKLRQILRETLANSDLTELLSNGAQIIELKEVEGVRLEIRKVESIGAETINIFPYQDKRMIEY
ncbi:hypothetical protein [Bacillus sp. REN16]|uniref:hypothetical protein n=1 Tax=Bacillus sp. REN16 TaxID=2887296 RepID=UPI001E5DA372|nr:hypothetical protein [Bacillus sp. REN16]MCC3359105.1 hypothetical protein [Bacillus sp. REN16]